jgi:hypothetical protein
VRINIRKWDWGLGRDRRRNGSNRREGVGTATGDVRKSWTAWWGEAVCLFVLEGGGGDIRIGRAGVIRAARAVTIGGNSVGALSLASRRLTVGR